MTPSKSVANKFHNSLNEINPIFAEMWRNGGMVFSDEYDTAALEIHEGKFRISFNPTYWKKIKARNKLFVICHEYLHVVLGHWLSPPDEHDEEWLNIAQDIQVNEMLVRLFGFARDEIRDRDEQAWLDTAFREKAALVPNDEDAEYYYKLLMKCLVK
jgi:predicted SprT family Zn-dependent metalloprotease